MNKQALYIHVPWCRRRCPYCDFYFVVGKPHRDFVSALIAEFEERASHWLMAPGETLYFGGGTPSMMRAADLSRLIQYFFDKKALVEGAEITLEANPEDLSAEAAVALAKTPINRISLGIQSFDNQILHALGRMHTSEQATAAIENLQRAGFKNISVDLILGVPEEDEKAVLQSLHKLAEVGIPHLSPYLLTIEEKTSFHRRIKQGRMRAPLEDDQVRIYRLVQRELTSLGYEQYDISSYGRAGFFSRHNQVYWAQGNYLGLGPGAHSMRLMAGSIERAHNIRPLNDWLRDPAAHDNYETEHLEPALALRESLAFGLRNMHNGIAVDELCQRHNCAKPEKIGEVVEKMKNYRWLREREGRLCITAEGALFADAVMAEILSCD